MRLTAEETARLRAPSASRLETARIVATRMMDDPEFRGALVAAEDGEYHLVMADPADTLADVFSRSEDAGLPVTVCVRIGSGIVPLRVREAAADVVDEQECGPDIEVGMLIELLIRTGGPVTISLTEPVQLAFAYA